MLEFENEEVHVAYIEKIMEKYYVWLDWLIDSIFQDSREAWQCIYSIRISTHKAFICMYKSYYMLKKERKLNNEEKDNVNVNKIIITL